MVISPNRRYSGHTGFRIHFYIIVIITIAIASKVYCTWRTVFWIAGNNYNRIVNRLCAIIGVIIIAIIISILVRVVADFIIKTPPAHALLMELTKKQAGSAEPNRKKIGTVSKDIIRKIALEKMPDLNCFTEASAMSMVAGSAKSAGYNVEGYK